MRHDYQTIDIAEAGGWFTLTLNRPEKRNALNDAMLNDLGEAFASLTEIDDARGLTLKGAGGIFCAGGDLKGFQSVFQGENQPRDLVEAGSRKIGEVMQAFNHLPMATIAVVEGAAIAGGMGLMCCADIVIAERNSKFSLTETTLGIPPAQIAPLIIDRVGLATARQLMLSAPRFGADAALNFGLVDMLVEGSAELAEQVDAIKRRILKCAPGANAVTKQLLFDLAKLDEKARIGRAAVDFAACMQSDEAREGIAAFFEKRKPNWDPEAGGGEP